MVDNGSNDGTAAYLAGVRDMASVPVTVVTNLTNLGFPAAVNQGLRLARGEYLVLLNNDVVVTDGWLEQLIGLVNAKEGAVAAEGAGRTCASDRRTVLWRPAPRRGVGIGARFCGVRRPLAAPPRGRTRYLLVAARPIGLVGPMSNYVAPPQLVENVPYQDVAEMQRFARQWRDEHRGQWFTVSKLSGFCLLMKRAVYDKIGGLDERFGLGLFDDDDLAERARRAGFELAVAHDLFVHHFGSRTFLGNGIDIDGLFEENATAVRGEVGAG